MKMNYYMEFKTRGEALQKAKSILEIKDYECIVNEWNNTNIYVYGSSDCCEIDENYEVIFVWKNYNNSKKEFNEFYTLNFGDKYGRERQDQEDCYDDDRTE